MTKVLFSFVGKGQFADKDAAKQFKSGYLPANYLFTLNDGTEKIVKKHIFVEAVLESGQYQFSSIYLFGTSTSSWEMLIYDLAKESEEMKLFWQELHESCLSGIEDDQKERLEKILESKYGVPVYINTHYEDLDKDTIDNVFDVYYSVAEQLAPVKEIIFDITHGFRSMPLLAYQSLLYNSVTESRRRIEIIYAQLRMADVRKGEDPMDPPVSMVRYLGRFWELSEGAVAVKLFKAKFDAELLSRLVQRYCAPLMGPLLQFDEIVRYNLIHNIIKFVENAQKVIDEHPLDETWPLWMLEAYGNIVDVCKRVGYGPVSSQLRSFSRLLHEKNLLVQSIIALRCAYEARVVEKIDPSLVGRYSLWTGGSAGKANIFLNKLCVPEELRMAMDNLRDLRNKVAHGVGDQYSRGEKVTVESLKAGLIKAEEGVDKFFALVKTP